MSKGEKFMKCEKDGISDLPHEILSSIVSYCTVRDAVSASMLSRRWRHLRASMADLIFDWDSMFQTHKDCTINCDFIDSCPQYKDRFVRGVNQFLQNYKGARLVSLKVEFCLGRDYTHEIDRWVNSAVSLGAERIQLGFSCRRNPLRSWRDDLNNLYIFRFELLSQADAPKLQYLALNTCALGPGINNQFGCLKQVILWRVPLGQYEVEGIFSCFMNLEHLMLISCTLPLKLYISSSVHRLKFLAVFRCWGVEEIELSAASLISFEYYGESVKLSCSRVPNLRKVYLGSRHWDDRTENVFGQLATNFPFVESLSIYRAVNRVQSLPECMTAFIKVKKFECFSYYDLNLKATKIIDILKSCPLLEKFHLMSCFVRFNNRGCKRRKQPTPQRLPPKSVHKHLKEIHIGGFTTNAGYMELALYLLDYAASLERMVIDSQCKVYIGDGKWMELYLREAFNEGDRAKIWLQLKDHSKSSVVVIC